MRNTLFFAALLLLLCTAITKGQVFNSTETSRKKHEMRIEIDSISCRNDLSRVYCRAIGHPNTSNRVDGVKLNGKIDATDIDPIYFKQAFQWEEDGVQPLEIDFPALKHAPSTFYLEFQTPYGIVRGAYSTKVK